MRQSEYSKLAQKALGHAKSRRIQINEVVLLLQVNTQLRRKDLSNEKRQTLIETGVKYASVILGKSSAV